MPKFVHNKNYARKWTFVRKLFKVAVVLSVILILLFGYILLDSIFRSGNDGPVRTQETTSTILPSIEVFQTDFFQFQTDKKWAFIEKDSDVAADGSGGSFLYRRTNNKLVEADMIIYVNDGPQRPETTRIMPVVTSSANVAVSPGDITDNCVDQFEPEEVRNAGVVDTEMEDVSFVCDVDGGLFTVALGEVDGGVVIARQNSDGTTTEYQVRITDYRVVPNPREFKDIVETLQLL